eukprot:c1056_g1_i1.p1 GENE.c1056_g1_i1~~c1056_g1_i1.p1  ORF type:complete len:534 (+),score=123.18 c1056_g1_i1:46-1602(+)
MEIVQLLRSKLHDAKAMQSDVTAIWLAEKIASMTNNHWSDVLELASGYLRTQQYARALATLSKHTLENYNIECRVVAAKCMFEMNEFQNCLALLDAPLTTPPPDSGPHQSALALIRARIFDSLEHKSNASYWYRESIRADVFNIEALDRLLQNHLLTASEISNFLAEIDFPPSPEFDWMRLVLVTRLSQPFDATLPQALQSLKASGLEHSVDIIAEEARLALWKGQTNTAFTLSKQAKEMDPYHVSNLLTHVCCLVEMGSTNDLYLLAHTLTRQQPQFALAWFAVGCYYRLTRNSSRARTLFLKATTMEPSFSLGWIALGHCCSEQDEMDNAIASYRTAARLFPANPVPWVCMGKEYLKSRNIPLADQFISYTLSMCPSHLPALHEHGVLLFESGKYEAAVEVFQKVLSLCLSGQGEKHSQGWEKEKKVCCRDHEVTVFNLAHSLRKLKRYEEALAYYHASLAINSKNWCVHLGIGFTYHLQHNLDRAVDHYHKSLSLNPTETLTANLLDQALKDVFN